MGGSYSGRYGRRSSRARVEDLSPLTISQLRRARVFDGKPTTGTAADLVIAGAKFHITFDTTRQRLGGRRWWFRCPRCGSRRARLSVAERWEHRAASLFRQAGCSINDDFHYKPKGMHWSRFDRLIDRAQEYETASMNYRLWPVLRRLGIAD